jgi:hypothetical protein
MAEQTNSGSVEITPAMLNAGAEILLETEAWDRVGDSTREMAARILTAMLALAPTPLRTTHSASVRKSWKGLSVEP